MMIFETPSKRETGGVRVGVFGSCRVRNPVTTLHDEGYVRICGSQLKATHSILELEQSVSVVFGEKIIPDELSPYIFELDQTPEIEKIGNFAEAGVTIFIAEISDSRQFVYRDYRLQQNFFFRRFVRHHGEALLPWYRQISLGKPVDETIVGSTLDRLRDAGFADNERVADILRCTRLTRITPAETSKTLSEVMKKVGGRWILVGAITVPDLPGALMRDRRELNADLEKACLDRGALFYDPTELIVAHGRATVLDADGADLYEYAPSFAPTVGQKILELVREPRNERIGTAPCRGKDAVPLPNAAVARRLIDMRALRINSELAGLHARRLSEMGLSASGLFAHYERLLSQDLIVGQRERTAATLLESYLPDYDSYAVMRAGLGELAFLIAASGRRVVAHEPNARRRLAIEAGLEHLRGAGLVEPGMVKVSDTLTPQCELSGRVLGVALDASEMRDDTTALPHVERCRAFDALLINPRLFIRLREEEIDQERLLTDLAALGFTGQRRYSADRLVWLRRVDANDDVVPPLAMC